MSTQHQRPRDDESSQKSTSEFLKAERPENVPGADDLGARFEHFRRHGKLPDLEADGGAVAANYDCPSCDGALVDRDGEGFICEGCGQVVFEQGAGNP